MDVRFDDTFELSSAALYLNLGHPSLTINLQWAEKIFILYIFYTPTFIALIYSSIFYDNFSKICTNLSLAVVYGIITINYGLLIVYKKSFAEMIKTVEEDLHSSRQLIAKDEAAVREYTAKGIQASRFWSGVCILCGSMFFCKAVVGTLYSALVGNFKPVAIHELTYPAFIEERKNGFLVYSIIFGLHTFYIVFTTLMYSGFNPLGPIFIMHACGQINLAIGQVERLFVSKDVNVDKTLNNLKNIARLIQHIYSFVGKIQQTHRILYEMCLKSSAIAIPIALFGIIESYNEGTVSFDLICYVFATVMQCSIPCYYCEVLLSKGEELRKAIYECGWESHWVPRTRSIILLMLARTARPLGIHAVFSTVSLEAFANVMNQAYKLFNVLNAAWN